VEHAGTLGNIREQFFGGGNTREQRVVKTKRKTKNPQKILSAMSLIFHRETIFLISKIFSAEKFC